MLAAAVLACAAHADVAPGDRITAENVERVKDLVSPGLEWCIRHGFPLTVTETRRIIWPQAYKEATEKYSQQVRLGADGLSLKDYVAGLPFPNLQPNDPQPAIKHMLGWNRKAVRLTLPALANAPQLAAAEAMCEIAAKAWTK